MREENIDDNEENNEDEREEETCMCKYCFCLNPTQGICGECYMGAHQG